MKTPFTDQDVENELRQLPQFLRNPKKDAVFLEMLHIRAEAKTAPQPQRGIFSAWKWVTTGVVSASILVGGTTFAAYQSTRGDLLYPVKKTFEQGELAFSFTPKDKVTTHLMFSDRRLDEANSIIQKNPSLNWLVPAAMADSSTDAGELDSEESKNLAATLEDMRSEIDKASGIVENDIPVAEEAKQALEKIGTTADRHVETLRKLNQKSSKSSQKINDVVNKIVSDEDDNLASIVEAQETVKDAISNKETHIKVKLDRKSDHVKARQDEASDELNTVVSSFNQLPIDQQTRFVDKVSAAKNALQEGKFGRSQGISRSLMNRMPHVPAPAVPEKRVIVPKVP